MKTGYKLGSMLLSALLALSSCQTEEQINPSMEGEPLSVNFGLAGSAGLVGGGVASRASKGETHSDAEKAVKTLWAIVFDDADGKQPASNNQVTDTDKFYRAIEIPIPEEQQTAGDLKFSFLLDKAGFFQICFIANPDENTVQFFEGLTSEKTVKDLKNYLIETKACDDKMGGLLMTSAFYPVESSWTTPYTINQVNLTRAMARIDVKNAIQGMNIYQIDFINRAVDTRLYQGNATTWESDITLETKSYTVALKGNSVNPAECKETIYTYEQKANTGQSQEEHLPALKICYTTDMEPEVQRCHIIKLVYTSQEGEQPQSVGLKRNHLYTVTLKRKAANITATIDILDWNKGEEIGVGPGEIGGGTTIPSDTGNGIVKDPGSAGDDIDIFE